MVGLNEGALFRVGEGAKKHNLFRDRAGGVEMIEV